MIYKPFDISPSKIIKILSSNLELERIDVGSFIWKTV